MPIFIITFDRRNPGGQFDYQPLIQELQAQKCFPLWENLWLGSFDNDATQLHNYFKRLMHEADRLAVCEMINHFCYSNAVEGANRWLELNPPKGGLEAARVPEPAAPAQQEATVKKRPAKKAPAKKAAAARKSAK